jgi:hypothetical protein
LQSLLSPVLTFLLLLFEPQLLEHASFLLHPFLTQLLSTLLQRLLVLDAFTESSLPLELRQLLFFQLALSPACLVSIVSRLLLALLFQTLSIICGPSPILLSSSLCSARFPQTLELVTGHPL